MLRTIGIVQARSGLPGERAHCARKLGGQSLLERVVRRVTDCQRLQNVVVVISDSAADESIFELVPRDVPVFVSARRDALARIVDVLDSYQVEAAVRVPADHALVDPVFIDRLVTTAEEHPTCDYIGYCARDGRPAMLSSLGVFAEWCRATALRTAERAAVAAVDREGVTRYLYSHPELFKLRLIPVPTELDRDDLRLSVDYEEDWEHLHTIYDALGAEAFDWRRIADLLHQHPAVRQRMADLNRECAKA